VSDRRPRIALWGAFAACFLAAYAVLAGLAPASACAQGLPEVPELPIPTLGPVDPTCSRAPDTDRDAVWDYEDNCHRLFNPSQTDTDKDSGPPPYEPVPATFRDPMTGGDACDVEDDNDKVSDVNDNCPKVANADQKDSDGDGTGDVCDPVAGGASAGGKAPRVQIRGLARSYRSGELRAGLAVPVRCSAACALAGTLRFRKAVLGRGFGGLEATGSTFVFVRLSAAARRRVARARRLGAKVTVRASDDVGHRMTLTRRVTLRR
jgi:hypothetical protein